MVKARSRSESPRASAGRAVVVVMSGLHCRDRARIPGRRAGRRVGLVRPRRPVARGASGGRLDMTEAHGVPPPRGRAAASRPLRSPILDRPAWPRPRRERLRGRAGAGMDGTAKCIGVLRSRGVIPRGRARRLAEHLTPDAPPDVNMPPSAKNCNGRLAGMTRPAPVALRERTRRLMRAELMDIAMALFAQQ